ncbi:hypothetical protein [Novipirellula maiorica]|uniref:hypothetical protein n=1 Tax=Novipirellula maiorica TaxID=1265734 RepID=UPI001181A786|nr:hypothetical protein [Rhodopirellula maiorica]
MATTTPVQEIVAQLNTQPFVLVSTLGQPVGVITRGDLEKPPMRMWLFGMITLLHGRKLGCDDATFRGPRWAARDSIGIRRGQQFATSSAVRKPVKRQSLS